MTEAPQPAPAPRKSRWPKIIALISSLTITAMILAFREQLVGLEEYGYAGVFLVAVISNATVILPVPGIAVVFASGGVLNPLVVGLVAGLGEPLGELTGYLAGYGGSAAVEDSALFARVRSWVERRGFVTVFLLAAIPNPMMDLAGMAAGMAHYPVGRFLLPCWLGKTTKALVIAFLGSVSLDWVTGLLG